jgi:hypothetical protein
MKMGIHASERVSQWGTLITFIVTVSIPHGNALAIDKEDLMALSEAVTAMCATPTDKGSYMEIEVEGDVGTSVLVKFVKAGVAGKLTKTEWEGIQDNVERYKNDPPGQCAKSIIGSLIPYWEPVKKN